MRLGQPVSHNRVIVRRAQCISADQLAARYCFSYTATLLTCCPLALTPLVVTVLVFPSADTTDVWVVVIFPPFFEIVCTVFALVRVRATISASGLLPLTGLSLPS